MNNKQIERKRTALRKIAEIFKENSDIITINDVEIELKSELKMIGSNFTMKMQDEDVSDYFNNRVEVAIGASRKDPILVLEVLYNFLLWSDMEIKLLSASKSKYEYIICTSTTVSNTVTINFNE